MELARICHTYICTCRYYRRYIFPENFLKETALFTVFLVTLLVLDKIFDMGGTINPIF